MGVTPALLGCGMRSRERCLGRVVMEPRCHGTGTGHLKMCPSTCGQLLVLVPEVQGVSHAGEAGSEADDPREGSALEFILSAARDTGPL